MGRRLTGEHPKPATLWQRRWRAKQKRRECAPNARGSEWGTPPDYIAAARAVMGGIDLDPATHPEAQARVQAARCYTKADNGLDREWHGRVFLNPPYARGLVAQFAMKLLGELVAGHTTEAIVLVNAQAGVRWFNVLQSAAAAWCTPARRLRFLDTEGRPGSSTVGQVFLYFGPAPDRFRDGFARFGSVVMTRPATAPIRDEAAD